MSRSDHGTVTAVGHGTATITATSAADPTKTETATVTVTITGGGENPVPVTGVKLDKKTISLTANRIAAFPCDFAVRRIPWRDLRNQHFLFSNSFEKNFLFVQSNVFDRNCCIPVKETDVPTPARTGYHFTGWYQGQEKYRFGEPLTQEFSLF